MSNCIFVDVSGVGGNRRTVVSDDDYFDTAYSVKKFILRGNNSDGDYTVFDEDSKTNYVSYVVHNIKLRGFIAYPTTDNKSFFGLMYVIIYKTKIQKNNQVYLQSMSGTKKDWSFYSHPELVLSYKTFKVGDDIPISLWSQQVEQPNKIDISYNKPILFRPDDVIVVEYTLFTITAPYIVGKFKVDASAEVRFNLV